MNWKESLATTFLVLGIIFIANNFLDQQPASITEAILTEFPTSGRYPTPGTPEPICENYDEVENFEEPIPVVWTAKMDGCLASCEGASFTRVPVPTPEEVGVPTKSVGKDKIHPRFAGYFPEIFQDGLLQDNAILKIHGDWVGIGADHPFTVFDNKCVPIININKIEVIK